jgi:predicted DsbA family dithiol-disulfide isomerase
MDDPGVESITVYSDYVCPFCHLGRESLARYRSAREAPLRVDWHPFDLRADRRSPDGSIDHDADDGKDEAYYERARENVRRLQQQYDVEMTREIATEVDSLPAQIVSVAVRDQYGYEQWEAFDGAVFEALWTDGRDIGDPDVLEALAADVGIDPAAVRAALDDDAFRESVRERFDEVTRRGVTGVPTFVYDGHTARGAVPPDQLARLVEGGRDRRTDSSR